MTVKGGPKIETDGLVFHLDAAASSIGKGYSTEGLRVEYLVVGGGGGGGGWSTAGGGGAGGFLSGETRLASGTYTVTVGAGGTRGDNSSSRTGTTGGNSQLGNSLVAYGGGGGGSISNINGLNGGSGGGGFCSSTAGVGGTGFSGQGNNGGNGGPGTWRSGSGGGAGQSGGLGNGGYGSAPGGRGKVAKLDFIWKYYAGGGASGGCSNGDNSGGLGGGGNGGRTNADGTNGQTNLGGGGGGGGCYNTRATFGGHGGSGIVMIRYWGKQKATGGDTIQYKNGYTIHTFTSSGSFVLTESIDGTSRNKIVGTLTNMDSSNYTNDKTFAFNLDGTDEKIVIPNFRRFTASESMTIESYVRLSTLNSYSTILQRGYSTGSYPKYYLRRANTQGWSFVVGDASGNVVGVTHSTIPSVGVWYYIVGTLDRDTDLVSLYVNGSLIGSNDCSSLGSIDNSAGELTIGDYIINATYSVFQGSIAKVAIYNIALSQQQILDNYNATKGRFGL